MLKYAIIGLSGRSQQFIKAILNIYQDCAQICAALDRNPKRLEAFNEDYKLSVPTYSDQEFDKMVDETRPDRVIISTTDVTHHIYIIAALKRDLDVVCEKPLTTDAEKVKAILAAEKASKGKVVVTHNMRYGPTATKIREMMMDGAIGRPTNIDFSHFLDTFHGASYFKRWNRYEEIGGTLLVTKACHYFDSVNWWLGQKPVEVFAYADRFYYGPDGPENPEKIDGRRCSTCKTRCEYFRRHISPDGTGSFDSHLISFQTPGRNELFGAVDGYYADRCIFDSDIDTPDTFGVMVRYDGGTILNFSLNASAPYEGHRAIINGTAGRIEYDSFMGKGPRLPFNVKPPNALRYFPLFEGMQVIDAVARHGGTAGADSLSRRDVFLGPDPHDRSGRYASAEEGAMAVLIGVAARESIKSGQPVRIADLMA